MSFWLTERHENNHARPAGRQATDLLVNCCKFNGRTGVPPVRGDFESMTIIN